jgi:hypothetical protein
LGFAILGIRGESEIVFFNLIDPKSTPLARQPAAIPPYQRETRLGEAVLRIIPRFFAAAILAPWQGSIGKEKMTVWQSASKCVCHYQEKY